MKEIETKKKAGYPQKLIMLLLTLLVVFPAVFAQTNTSQAPDALDKITQEFKESWETKQIPFISGLVDLLASPISGFTKSTAQTQLGALFLLATALLLVYLAIRRFGSVIGLIILILLLLVLFRSLSI